MRTISALFVFAAMAAAQNARPPVVFVRGYDFNALFGFCSPSDAAGTFGGLPAQLQTDGLTIYSFDHCAEAGRQILAIENLGQLFRQFLAKIPAPQVDVVAHSMGGLIVRSYLAGISATPPQNTKIRKIVFIASPHFGVEAAAGTGTDPQIMEMRLGSSFLYGLARWNQETDDLRGIDALSVIGDSGIGGRDDGLVSINSASLLSFERAMERTRVLPYCHAGILAALGACTGIGIATAPETATIVRSFLADSTDWATTGRTISTGAGASGGVFLTARDSNDGALAISGVTYDGGSLDLGTSAFFKNFLAPRTYAMKAGPVTQNVSVEPARFVAPLVKALPVINAIIPSAGASDARVVAPGQLVSFYGAGLASSTVAAAGVPFPVELGGTTISSRTVLLPLLRVSDGQVNAYVPSSLSGFVNITLKNAKGQHTTTLLVAPAAPALFSLSFTGAGPAAALHAGGSLIDGNLPAATGEVASLYGTGLGLTASTGGLDVAVLTPAVIIGGVPATVTFAGRAPGFTGLDQINVQIPAGVKGDSVPVLLSSGGRTSNTVTLAIQ